MAKETYTAGEAAAALGIVGIWHRDYDQTAGELEALFGLALA